MSRSGPFLVHGLRFCASAAGAAGSPQPPPPLLQRRNELWFLSIVGWLSIVWRTDRYEGRHGKIAPTDGTYVFLVKDKKCSQISVLSDRKYQFSSVPQSCPTLCDPMNHSMPGLPVHYQLPESTQIHVH